MIGVRRGTRMHARLHLGCSRPIGTAIMLELPTNLRPDEDDQYTHSRGQCMTECVRARNP